MIPGKHGLLPLVVRVCDSLNKKVLDSTPRIRSLAVGRGTLEQEEQPFTCVLIDRHDVFTVSYFG